MSGRKSFDAVFRAAIWEAHGKRCGYTNEPIEFADLEIDHIIPLHGSDSLVAALKQRKVIGADFDLNGLENLFPTSGVRNRQKSATQFNENSIVYFLEIAASRADKARTLHNEARASDRAVLGYLRLKAHAQQNDLTIDEVIENLRHQVDQEVTLRFAPEIEGEAIRAANAETAAALLKMPFALGGGTIREVPLHDELGTSVACTTAAEFLDARAKGFEPKNQFEINACGLATRTSELLRGVMIGRFASRSEIRFPRITLADVDRWSAVWVARHFIEREASEAACDRYRSIADLVEAGLTTINSQDDWSADFDSPCGFSVHLRELLRADFDGDDEEEILVDSVAYAREGTFRAGRVELAKMRNGQLTPVSLP